MTARNSSRSPGEGQTDLFSLEPEQPAIPEMGISITLTERAQYLGYSLASLAQASQRDGLSRAAQTPHREGLEERYGKALPSVLEGADRNRHDYAQNARITFDMGAGYMALQASGVVEPELLAREERDDYIDFYKHFAGTDNRQQRDRFRNALKRARSGK